MDDHPGRETGGFIRRLRRRHELWWGRPFHWERPSSYLDAFHRFRERLSERRYSDPDETWRCCRYWQRSLIDKRKSREFATRHGCRLPKLYWQGSQGTRIPFETLPPDYVIRNTWSLGRRGVQVMSGGRELLSNESLSETQLRARIAETNRLFPMATILAEEFAMSPGGIRRLPLEYKCYTFGERVAAIQVVNRVESHIAKQRYYTPTWEPFRDDMDTSYALDDLLDPPACREEIVSSAARLGKALGTFMRIDFFATPQGALFTEFSSTPQITHPGWTPHCNELFESIWAGSFPEAS